MTDDNWFIINDIDDFTDKVRVLVYNNYGSWDNESKIDTFIDNIANDQRKELNEILSHKEALLIVKSITKQQKNKKTQSIRFLLNENLFTDIIHSINERMTSNILQSLVKKGLIESSYDSKLDDFVFWVKENHESETEKDKDQNKTD